MRGRYLLKRFLLMIVTLWVLITIIFFLFRIMPADPTALFIGASLHPESQKMMMQQFGLDQPKLKQYFIYMKNLFKGEFGISIRTNQQVLDMLRGKIWNTTMYEPSLMRGSGGPKTSAQTVSSGTPARK